MEVQIRAYETSDIKKLSEIWFGASSRVHAFLGEQRLREQRTLIEDTYLPRSETWVACQNGKPVGFIALIDTFIGGLFVDPAMQGSGIGRALVAHALNLKGELKLEVYALNLDAHAFYQRLGFEEVTRQAEEEDGLPFEVVQMRFKATDHSANEPTR
ncbi:GNAT family N-acetyltransferase [Burkholderia sp. FERM BP-3421]|uniref:GNAT family N-acetyltransferase n=1 Tax=Burkholderia sp. FERM BP-3421 TaxID=1494466 RepID=UPI00235F1385|nr:GNAT family N-acetyltransferase [Burkholderia sp. FERM BP-3421]WDD92847.1 GNAT family N-acetyltransferase [Burkholderia sp. FERM BP-3421]